MATRTTEKRKGLAATGVNHWLTQIAQAIKPYEDPIPAGYETRREIEERAGISRHVARARLTIAIDAGMVEVRRFRRLHGNTLRHIPYYRPVPKPGA